MGMTTTIVVCPGQGAQRPRMLTPWARNPVASAQLREWSLRAGIGLTALGTEASMAEISRTENAQPLLVAQALLIMAEVTDRSIAVAGHSVGELAAAAMAGVLEPGEAVRLARLRGLAMAEACRAEETTMAAVLGGDPAIVTDAIEAAGAFVANWNGAGQVVAAGSLKAVERLASAPPEGCAVKRLAVAGAFHTPYMQPALEAFALAADEVPFRGAAIPIIQNLDGRVIRDGDVLRDRLVRQATAPVRWDLCMDTIGSLGPETIVAAPPGKTLSGMVRRQLPSSSVVCITTPRDLTRKA